MMNKKTYQGEYVASDLVRVIRKMEKPYVVKQSASKITPEYLQMLRKGLVTNASITIGRKVA